MLSERERLLRGQKLSNSLMYTRLFIACNPVLYSNKLPSVLGGLNIQVALYIKMSSIKRKKQYTLMKSLFT